MDGIRRRHSRRCPSRTGKRCNCGAGWEAAVYDEAGRKIRRSFRTEAAARAWRIDSLAARRRGEFRAPGCQSIREAGKTLIEGMESGSVRTRSGELYKPSAIRSYETCLRVHIYPDLGGAAVGDIRRRDVQALADRMLSGGANASTIRNALMPLRVIFRRLIEDDELTTNPCTGLRLPAVRGKRDRVASLDEAAHLIDALPTACYRALWATAFYVGLRLGELRGLRWEDVSLGENLIHVHRAIDQKGQVGTPKSAAGVRRIPIVSSLRSRLLELHIELRRPETGYVFGQSRPPAPSTIHLHARAAWKAAKLKPIGLHEARHTCASIMIAAGVNARAIAAFMGHSSIQITFDRYGHLMPGSEQEAAALIDDYVRAAAERREGPLVRPMVRPSDMSSADSHGRSGTELESPSRSDELPKPAAASGFRCKTAEGERFELSIRQTTDNGFRDRRIRPLCHPSDGLTHRRQPSLSSVPDGAEKEGFEPSRQGVPHLTP